MKLPAQGMELSIDAFMCIIEYRQFRPYRNIYLYAVIVKHVTNIDTVCHLNLYSIVFLVKLLKIHRPPYKMWQGDRAHGDAR